MSSVKHEAAMPCFGKTLGYLSFSALAALVFFSGTAAAFAAPTENATIYGADLKRLNDNELRKLRGGINVAGVDFDFGAVVHLSVDGTLVAETTYTMNPNGSLSHVTDIKDPALASSFSGDPSQMLAGTGISVSGSSDSAGVIIKNQNGTSVTLNNITAGGTHALLANNAMGRQITQTVEANLTINNFTQLNGALMNGISTIRAMQAGMTNPILTH